jgi:hypothetical protein
VLLLSRGMLLSKEDYRQIVSPAIKWGFELDFDGRLGSDRVRRALEEAAIAARGEAYTVIAEEFCKLMNACKFDLKEDWFLHSVRAVCQTLLANPACCPPHPNELVNILTVVNQTQRARTKR